MFENIPIAPPDAILGLSEAFQNDPHPEKINLSVGVYKDSAGLTPVLKCVKAAERRLVDSEKSKGYLGIDGMPEYARCVSQLLFGPGADNQRISVVQTPGGTGGLRVAGELIASQLRPKKIWVSNPTWANHNAVFAASGLVVDCYPYLNSDKTGLDFDAMLDALTTQTEAGDVVLLHACCHNPTGIDPSTQQWAEIARVLNQRKLLPLIDFAYQGFGRGLQEDTVAISTLLEQCDEMMVVSSFSKNFGLYSERIGALALVARDQAASTAAMSQMKRVVRTLYSNPPRHGAAIVSTILADSELTGQWHQELEQMRQRIAEMRSMFVDQMQARQQKRDFSFLREQAGMFSFSGLSAMQVDRLRSEHAIYIVGSGRINVAGMTPTNIPRLCDCIAAVL